MARFAVWVVAYGVALWIVSRTTGSAPTGLWLLFWATFIPAVFYYLYRLIKFSKDILLWRLRRRLVVAYVFIAVVPVFLILVLVALGTWLVNSQFASYLVASKLRDRAAVLRHLDRMIVHEADHVQPKSPEALLDELQSFFISDFREHASNYPGLTITLRLGSLVRTSSLDPNQQQNPVTLPSWLKEGDFSAIVVDQGKLALRAVDRQRTSNGELIVVLSQPFTPDLLDLVGEGIGPIVLLTPREMTDNGAAAGPRTVSRAAGAGPKSPDLAFSPDDGRVIEEASIQSKSVTVPKPANSFDYIVYNWASLDPIFWGGDAKIVKPEAGVFLVTSRYLTLDRQLLSTLGEYSGLYWSAFAVVGVVFLVIELVAMVIGFQMTRSITGAVDKVYEGTKRVQVGDFSYRIGLPARDQLSALGEAFDGMTSSVERLLRESLEKTRLEGELEIAREVQTQLFPQAVPAVAGLQLFGVCKPARTVSGDYYDFLRLGEDRVGLVVGDISGKGISAALLMASVQSALHAQFYDEHELGILSEAALMSSASVVGRLNRQLYASTPTEKYATFFYAIYDGATRQLTFTNAGHPPPFYFHRGNIERLETGGTVVGLFGPATYEQAVIQLEPGDMLVAFTDGMTEPENNFGEEFGEERLLAAAERASACPPAEMAKEIYRAVNDWTGSPELQDDMTLVVALAVE